MRGEQSRAAALFDVGGDKNDDDTDDDNDVFVGGGGGGGVGACANMYGRKPTKVVLFLCEAAVQRHKEQKLQTVPLNFPSPFCASYLGF